MKKLLAIAGCALAGLLPAAALAGPAGGPSKPLGSGTAVIHLICNHYDLYHDGYIRFGDTVRRDWVAYVYSHYCR
jgi:hypothetical protein